MLAAVTTGRAVHLLDTADPRRRPALAHHGVRRPRQFAGDDLLMTTNRTAVHLWDAADARTPVLRAVIRPAAARSPAPG
ncbi:hypothetical protein BBK82_24845 [Lentzea guizhouensis]|uniref:Uncharacterized protein n=1 Tax=Lentzea guizhouensis TaxID=1586287 RepID=A0A1B2HM89_9PSEU|nr:hypothetical protein [Lentzea guizhouensis]ANZ38811.1 hypothetical protein BBK82_24845 [Lentzea guizhouensis]